MQKNTKQSGFTLIELLITLAIIGILITVAYPSYTHYLTRTHRAEAQIALADLAARMEHYYSENNHSYSGATLNKLGVTKITEHGFYTLAITHLSATTYTLEAKPAGIQAQRDTACATLTLNQLGQKGKTGIGDLKECW
jgi:type IV pilus assembly protein PilE